MLDKAIKQITNATRYSLGGFGFLVRSEFAARLEVYGFVIVFGLYVWLGVPAFQLLIASVLFCLLLATEALNTAIEVIIDRVSPEISKTGKRAKDLGSFAVFCLLTANMIHLVYVLVTALAPSSAKLVSAGVIILFFLAAAYTKSLRHDPRKHKAMVHKSDTA